MNIAIKQDDFVRHRFELEFAPVRHLLGFVEYSPQIGSYRPKGSDEDSRVAASMVNIAWSAWVEQQVKLDAKDKLLIQQGQAYNEQSQKVKDLEYKLSLDFELVNPDAVLVLARVNFCKFHSHEQMRNELDHLTKAFKKAGKQVIVFDSGYSLEVMTDEQLNDVGLKRTSVEHLKVVPKVKHFVEHLEINKNAP
ncbi:TPA: hypothetical protein OTT47_000289 [Acinetobacter nosocomialis]|uniref:hypothetical protein n=1 Tax=Acinetobacter nosocomialis TaxID=106654 RepID=UPI000DE7B3B2|nr:hypothetical protein [Acinetobacter nosocomialis]SSR60807.1 Uncharacterised protein [Acinetobacter nosocomialis]HCT3318149.1 hypothetical protein [Acinetobacter nosocomialis]